MHAIRLALLMLMVAASSAALSQVVVSVRTAPPPLPVYEQPVCPGEGYIWTPGYWAYGPDGYYWVPGTWVLAPQPGLLWTPGYWAWSNGGYVWNVGYWSPAVGLVNLRRDTDVGDGICHFNAIALYPSYNGRKVYQ